MIWYEGYEFILRFSQKSRENHFAIIFTIILRRIGLGLYPLWKEYICAIQESTNDKSPGLNGVSLNAFKSMSEENLRHHFNFITDLWEDKVDFEE